jgi:hypothetical protein
MSPSNTALFTIAWTVRVTPFTVSWPSFDSSSSYSKLTSTLCVSLNWKRSFYNVNFRGLLPSIAISSESARHYFTCSAEFSVEVSIKKKLPSSVPHFAILFRKTASWSLLNPIVRNLVLRFGFWLDFRNYDNWANLSSRYLFSFTVSQPSVKKMTVSYSIPREEATIFWIAWKTIAKSVFARALIPSINFS